MKKLKLSKQKIACCFVLIFFVISSSEAQSLEDALGFAETVNDVPEAPIHLLIPVALTIGAFLGLRKLK